MAGLPTSKPEGHTSECLLDETDVSIELGAKVLQRQRISGEQIPYRRSRKTLIKVQRVVPEPRNVSS